MNFANNIKAIRKENNLSQEQLAEKLGVSRQSVSKWESGQSYPEMDKILLICNLFNCDIGELMNDNIKEINETKQSKTKINKTIEDFFDYITRLVEMFMAMTFKQKFKCLLEQLINIGVLILICLLAWAVLDMALSGIFGFLEASWFTGIMTVFNSLFIIVSIIFSLTTLLHIFKIRYLDYYEIVKPEKPIDAEVGEEQSNEENTEPQNNDQAKPAHKSFFSRSREKIIIRDPKHSSSRFLISAMKAIVLFFKLFLGLVGICVAISFICLLTLLVTIFLFAKTGLLFIGIFLVTLAILALNFVILRLIYNLLASRKSRKNITALILILSLITSGIGMGLTFIGTTQFNIINTSITEKSEFTIPMSDNLSIGSGHCPIKYVDNNSNEVKIEVIHSEYREISLENYNDTVYVYVNDITNSFEMLRTIIKDINNKQINSYLFDNPINSIIIYSSKTNIEKLKANDEFNLSAEEKIQKLHNETENLENENIILKDQLAEKEWIINEKNIEIKDKDEIINYLEAQVNELTK